MYPGIFPEQYVPGYISRAHGYIRWVTRAPNLVVLVILGYVPGYDTPKVYGHILSGLGIRVPQSVMVVLGYVLVPGYPRV